MRVSKDAAFADGLFAAGDAFEEVEALRGEFVDHAGMISGLGGGECVFAVGFFGFGKLDVEGRRGF